MKWNKTIGDRVSGGGLPVARSQQHRQFGDPLCLHRRDPGPLIEQPSVRCRIVNLIRGRCLIEHSNTARGPPLPPYSASAIAPMLAQ